MTVYRLNTNEGERYVRATLPALREAMSVYVRAKRASGVPIAAIIFCWAPIRIGTL